MISPKVPINEKERLDAVKSYKLVDTLPESEYDNITSLVSDICELPISLITLLDSDRNFFKSHHGIDIQESPRDISFCGHAINQEEDIFIINDARLDARFKDNPLVKESQAIFYAGAPLINPDGLKLGTLCVFDTKPRELTESQIKVLINMAKQVVKLFELHKKNNELLEIEEQLLDRNVQLKSFAGIVSHDLKSPLANITSLARLFKEEYLSALDDNAIEYLDYIEESSDTLREYIDGMLIFYKSDELVSENKKDFNLKELFKDIEEILFVDFSEFKFPNEDLFIHANRAALFQVLMNLVGNSIKYNDNKSPLVSITFSATNDFYYFEVKDNGVGIAKDKQESIFDLFKTGDNTDRFGKKGTGIGLATVKAIVTKLGGEIQVVSEIGKGATFSFSIKK
ncbi:sensor histidine kinase/GAF domain hybrid protein [unidentified eubacterium SCB49]|nr:sensor histidine kinase/GAF domain hybrid protein [unidentified eubacterium SCB49]